MVDDDDVLAEVLDEVELVAGEEHGHPGSRQLRSNPAMAPIAMGSSPAKGSSRTSRSGSLTKAAM